MEAGDEDTEMALCRQTVASVPALIRSWSWKGLKSAVVTLPREDRGMINCCVESKEKFESKVTNQ